MSTNNYTVSTDKARLDLTFIHDYLSKDSYWAQGRTLDTVKRSIEASLCFGVYCNDEQVGFARVITDHATFAYLADVFIADEHRGRGLSKKLMEEIMTHPQLQGLRRWMLGTRDAHTLYEKFGFKPLAQPVRWMERSDDSCTRSK